MSIVNAHNGGQVLVVDLLDAGQVGGLYLVVVNLWSQDNSLVLLHQELVHIGDHLAACLARDRVASQISLKLVA